MGGSAESLKILVYIALCTSFSQTRAVQRLYELQSFLHEALGLPQPRRVSVVMQRCCAYPGDAPLHARPHSRVFSSSSVHSTTLTPTLVLLPGNRSKPLAVRRQAGALRWGSGDLRPRPSQRMLLCKYSFIILQYAKVCIVAVYKLPH